jgi:hypothetical protein
MADRRVRLGRVRGQEQLSTVGLDLDADINDLSGGLPAEFQTSPHFESPTPEILDDYIALVILNYCILLHDKDSA